MLAKILIAVIAFLHIYIMIMECFLWETRAYKVFRGYNKEFFKTTKVMAFNQGVYNGFLAAGLIWSLFINDESWFKYVSMFFLSCVAVAGLAGAYSADRKILLFQTVPALLAMAAVIYYF